MRRAPRASTRPSSASIGANTWPPARRWRAIAAAAMSPSAIRSTARSCSRTRSATICASPPASGRIYSRSVPTCCCICTSKGRRPWCRWISPARACTGAVTAAEGGRAPLKENVAAAVLLRAGWPQIAESGGTLLDPMCGSGTFLTEGALIAADAAPAMDREYFGFLSGVATMRRCGSACVRRRWRGAARAWRGAASWVRTSTPKRCGWPSPTRPRPGVADWVHVEKRALERS